ncbi:DNA-binding response regulator [Tengunoibacter tsumagoiensis]|uniref:DNA-binding response regulator n=2 Tax=Tengunoibacter tsumagoiensis TaxID=2014871 RepID=A0A401ZZX8_9CHLR|nr:DNA-binding response regulator [Tengunoibacter tsumagoiensis]
MAIQVLLVDDHSLVREGVRRFLSRDPELKVIGEAANGEEAIRKARDLRPDVILLDLLLPDMDGIVVTSVLHTELPEIQVIILTSVLEESSLMSVMRAGAIGYLLKDAQAADLRQAVKGAAAGQIQISAQASACLLREVRALEGPDPLTVRETDVLRLLAQGYSNKEIVSLLHISEDTVKTHVRHVLAKLGVRSRTQATLAAMRLGLVPLASP